MSSSDASARQTLEFLYCLHAYVTFDISCVSDIITEFIDECARPDDLLKTFLKNNIL